MQARCVSGAMSVETILEPGETVTWQGRPEGSFVIGVEGLALGLFGLLVLGIAWGFSLVFASAGISPWPCRACGAGLAVACVLLFPMLDMLNRRRTRYLLTDRRALIVSGAKVAAYPVSSWRDIVFRPGPPDTVHFARRRNSRAHGSSLGRPAFDVGFERIEGGAQVYRRMLDMQDGRKHRG